MNEMQRREFLKTLFVAGTAITTLSTATILSACSSSDESQSDLGQLSMLRVSSDVYKTDLIQRFAFAIFDQDRNIASSGDLDIELTSPSNKKKQLDSVKLRESGIKDRGIYSFESVFNEVGSWNIRSEFKDQALELNFTVNEVNSAPGLGQDTPTINTPTDNAPLDAEILCTSATGNCRLHKNSVPELLATQKPFVVLFATPARCQTAYCGPVLDLTKEVAEKYPLETVHIEIYKNETSSDVLDAVTGWNLPSEPWLFLVSGEGKILKRLDGAFDKSEVEEVYKSV